MQKSRLEMANYATGRKGNWKKVVLEIVKWGSGSNKRSLNLVTIEFQDLFSPLVLSTRQE